MPNNGASGRRHAGPESYFDEIADPVAARRLSRFIPQSTAGPHAEHNELVAFYSQRFRYHRQMTGGDLDQAQELADADTQRLAQGRGLVWKRERSPDGGQS